MANSGQQNAIDEIVNLVSFMDRHGIDWKGLNTLEELKERAKQELRKRNETQSLSAGKV